MKQRELYIRDIHKDIDGVVKAADLSEATLYNEIQEYVLTDELMGANLLPRLFDELSERDFNKSIWISGYFGSGKSHLLKILSLVLSDKNISGESSAKMFSEKVTNDFELTEYIKRVAAIPTETILFNIQTKSDGITSSNADPVLAVFIKVFNEHLGFSDNPKIASFERYLDEKGKFSQFLKLYQSKYDKPWEQERNQVLLNVTRCAEVFSEIEDITIDEAKSGIRDYMRNYTLDTNTFAKLVVQYLETKSENARLIFCIDEVGQYIAEDTGKMLSLQSITEDISTKTQGRAFAIVTSQNDLTATVGDIKKDQKNDFSKITGRFAFKIALTSANADEVIQKRLLAKTDVAKDILEKVFEKEKNNIKTLFKFEGETPFNIKYKDVNHFVNTYPFLAYQFDLLQSTIMELQKNNAFMGRHQSLGERSMLSICQQVVQNQSGQEIGTLVGFGAMFDGLVDMFQGNVTNDIIQADKLLNDDFAVNVLKVLFLVKYEKRLKTTIDNIVVLMQPSFDVDLVEFKKKVQHALNRLESNTYIHRTASGIYEYLTNQEKDIENEIKNIDPERGAIQRFVQTILFDELYTAPKIQIGKSKYKLFEYGKKCDDNNIGQVKDIYLHFITPLCEDDIIRNNIKQYSMSNHTDLVVVLSENTKLKEEVILHEQTHKYIRVTHPMEHEVFKAAIRVDKGIKNTERKTIITEMLRDSLTNAKLYVNGNEISLSSGVNIKDKISGGLTELIESVYTSLRMLDIEYTDDTIVRAIKVRDDIGLEVDMSEAEAEVMNRLQRNKGNHERTTIKGLINLFKSLPYGWYPNATLSLIAMLYRRSKISLKQDGTVLKDDNVLKSLQNSRSYETTIIEIEDKIQTSQIVKLKSFYQNYFGKPCAKNEPRELHSLVVDELVSYLTLLEKHYIRRLEFKFLNCLKEPLEKIGRLTSVAYPYLFIELPSLENILFEDKEEILDKVTSFMDGNQVVILKQVGEYLKDNSANRHYFTEGNFEKLQSIYDSPTPYLGGLMLEAKSSLEAMSSELMLLLQSQRDKTIEEISQYKDQLSSFGDFTKLTESEQSQLISGFDEVIKDVRDNRFIANIRERASYIKDEYYSSCLAKMNAWLTQASIAPKDGGSQDPENPVEKITYINRNSVKIPFAKPSLETKEDVEEYLETLKKLYMEIIKENKRISL